MKMFKFKCLSDDCLKLPVPLGRRLVVNLTPIYMTTPPADHIIASGMIDNNNQNQSIVVKFKRSSLDGAITLKVKEHGGLFGKRKEYSGDVNVVAMGQSVCMGCVVNGESARFTFKLMHPVVKEEIHIGGTFRRLDSRTHYITVWQAEIRRNQASLARQDTLSKRLTFKCF